MAPSIEGDESRRSGQRDDRGQMGPIGMTLVFGLVMVGAVLIVAFGVSSLGGAEESLDNQRAEKTLTQFDSKAALVALGNTDTQTVTLATINEGNYVVREDRGWMNISYVNASGESVPIVNETMGAITYESSDTTVAYQGGGVWRTSGGANSVMVSPPEFHYRDRTLTVPLVTVSGAGSLDSDPVISHNETVGYFPNKSKSNFLNPVAGTEVNVTVHSEYFLAWGQYFEERTQGDVSYNYDRRVAMISLVPPFDEKFDSVVSTTKSNGITVNGNDPDPSPSEEGTNYPTVDGRIERKIADCESGSVSCTSLADSNQTITTPGTYYVDGDFTSALEVDSPGGNVTVIVDGTYGPDIVDIVNLSSPHAVDVFVREDFEIGEYNLDDGDPYESRVLVHSDGDVTWRGDSKFVGLVYAPQSDCDFNGGGKYAVNLNGSAACRDMDINGNPNNFAYDASVMEDISLDLTRDDVTQLQYLHITTNDINVTSD
jgi:hypothetical protein